jgi:DHA2 family multidrug resistance protein
MTPAQRYLTLMTVVLGSSLYGTALLTTSTILPQMQGALSATQDEIAWVMTFNILATAVVTPMTGWLVSRFGTKRVMIWSIACFTAATMLCGLAQSLEMLVLWRIAQGGAGAPLVPLSQSILFATFPRRQHTMVMSIFGMAVAVAPAFGPVFGGYLAEMHSWRWSFYMLIPVGIAATIGMALTLPADKLLARVRFDWTGFIALATALAAVQLVLARGVRLDWFESTEIVIECLVAAIAFYAFLVHSFSASQPFVNLKLLSDRNYAIGLALVTIYGMLNFTPVVLLPPLLQQHAGYPDNIIGAILGMRGIGATIGFFLAMFAGRLEPRIGMTIGFGIMAISGLWLMSLNLDVDMSTLAANSILQGMAVGIIWVPLTVTAFATLDTRHTPEAMALFHLLRNIGSSFFISICVAEIVRTTGENYSRMTEMVSPYHKSLSLPWVMGGWSMDSLQGLARLAKEINRQAAMIGYVNAFALYTATSVAAIAVVVFAKKRQRVAVAAE